jgi:hypothetical protein
MNAGTTRSVWLGYTRVGGRFAIREDELNGGVALLGQGAKDLAAMLAYSCNEAGLKTAVIDLDGYLSDRVSGYVGSSTVRLAASTESDSIAITVSREWGFGPG